MHTTTWLPPGWQHPARVALPTGHHLRPLRVTDVDLDMKAVLGSQERLWAEYGGVWAWPPADLTAELHRADLARHELEAQQGLGFRYGLFDAGETELLGRVTVESVVETPGRPLVADVSWWVVDWLVGGPVEAALAAFVPEWITTAWPLTETTQIRYRTPRRTA